MAKIGSVQITWDDNGEIAWMLNFSYDDPQVIYSLGGVALVDHVLATLSADKAFSLCEDVLRGLMDGHIKVKSVNTELKSADLQFHQGKGLFTVLKPKTKLFANNERLEDAVSQMVKNYIGRLMSTVSKENLEAVTFGIIGVVSSYEKHLREMREAGQSARTTRTNVARAVAFFINKYPYGVQSDDVERHLAESEALIEKLRSLGLPGGRPVFRQ